MVKTSKMLLFKNRGILFNPIISNIIVLLLQPTVNTTGSLCQTASTILGHIVKKCQVHLHQLSAIHSEEL